jgi:hypothetical protein
VGSDARASLLSAFALDHEAATALASARLAMFGSPPVGGLTNPVEVLVRLNYRMAGVDEDYLVPLVLSVFTYPLGIQDLHIAESPSSPLLGDALDGLGHGDLSHSHVPGSSISDVPGFAQSPASNLDPRDNYALFGLVA